MNEALAASTVGPLVLDLEIAPHVFTPERTRLLRTLRDDGPFPSLAALAQQLGRHVSHVSRDLNYLEGIGLVKRHRDGRRTAIHAAPREIRLE